MDISFLSEYMIPVIVGICLCVGCYQVVADKLVPGPCGKM